MEPLTHIKMLTAIFSKSLTPLFFRRHGHFYSRFQRVLNFISGSLLLFLASSLSSAEDLPLSSFDVLKAHAQDETIFVQGFLLEGDTFYYSSGRYKKSFISKQDRNGHEVTRLNLEEHYFAEGLTLLDQKLYLVTWKSGEAFVYNAGNFKLLEKYNFEGEGWGLTSDKHVLYLSNGSHYIQVREPDTFNLVKYLRVTHDGKPLNKINELEYADGAIWANIWFDNHVYRIDPQSGKVTHRWDLSELHNNLKLEQHGAVLNGLAFDEKHDAFWVTGKLWPMRYLIKFDI